MEAATTIFYTLSLHDALPISHPDVDYVLLSEQQIQDRLAELGARIASRSDRKSTRLNSSHVAISYAVFCLKKKNTYAIIIYNIKWSSLLVNRPNLKAGLKNR